MEPSKLVLQVLILKAHDDEIKRTLICQRNEAARFSIERPRLIQQTRYLPGCYGDLLMVKRLLPGNIRVTRVTRSIKGAHAVSIERVTR